MSGLRSQTFRIKRGADGFKRSGDKLGAYLPPNDVEWVPGSVPQVVSVSGSLVNGEELIISGAGFSAHRQRQLIYIDPDSVGTGEAHPEQKGYTGNATYLAREDSSFFGSKVLHAEAYGEAFPTACVQLDTASPEMFFEGWMRSKLPNYSSPPPGGDAPQVKLWRMVGGAGGQSAQNVWPTVGFNYLGVSMVCYGRPPEGTNWSGKDIPNMDSTEWSEWIRFTAYGRLHDSAGERYALTSRPDLFSQGNSGFNAPSGSVYPGRFYGEPLAMPMLPENPDESLTLYPDAPGFQRLFFPYFHRNWQSTEIQVTHILVNDSPERVVLGNAATWNAVTETKRVSLETLSRTTNTVRVRLRLGPLISGPLYLYVVNRDGKYNETGFQLRG